jgi:hypothetical protein
MGDTSKESAIKENGNARFRKAHKVISSLMLFSTSAVLGANIFATAVFPVGETILKDIIKNQVATPELANGLSVSLYIIYFLHLIFAVYSIIGVFKLKELLKLAQVDEMEQSKKQVDEELENEKTRSFTIRSQRDASVQRQLAILGSLSVLSEIIQSDVNLSEKEKPKKDVGSLLAPLIKARTEVLQFCSKDFHNFAIYCYDKTSQSLYPFYRDCDDRIERHDRVWKVGRGHVGIAFAQNRTIITGDVANNPELQEMLKDDFSEKDQKFYKSFISSPFSIVDNIGNYEQFGVFVITSSRSDHFNEDERLVAVSYSAILSMYFSNRIKVRKL